MKIAFGCDHAGFDLKFAVLKHLESRRIQILDYGTDSTGSVDYADFARDVSFSVADGQADFGILICGTGLGMAISANKIPGIRAVTVSEPFSAQMARAHNDANILTFGSRVIGPGMALSILDAFLDTPFEGGRHCGRIEKITSIENMKGNRESSDE